MIQLYLLSIAFMVLSSLILLPENWKRQLSFLILFRSRLSEDGRARRAYFLSGFAIGMAHLFFPMPPGPMMAGDLIPSATVLFLAFLIFFVYSEKRDEAYFESLRAGRLERIGKVSLVIAFIHFLVPSLVLL